MGRVEMRGAGYKHLSTCCGNVPSSKDRKGRGIHRGGRASQVGSSSQPPFRQSNLGIAVSGETHPRNDLIERTEEVGKEPNKLRSDSLILKKGC